MGPVLPLHLSELSPQGQSVNGHNKASQAVSVTPSENLMAPIKSMKNRLFRTRDLSLRQGSLRHMRELVLILGSYFVYMLVRRFIISDIENVAFDNTIRIVSFELAGGFFWEPRWQAWAVEHSIALIRFQTGPIL